MTRKRNPVVWVTRENPCDGIVQLWATKPKIMRLLNSRFQWWWDGRSRLTSECYSQFYRITGLKLEPGECKQIRINVEVLE